MSRLFPTASMIELDHVQCCNRSVDSDSSSSDDPGVVYTGQLNTVVKTILELWPASTQVDVHLRQRSMYIIDG